MNGWGGFLRGRGLIRWICECLWISSFLLIFSLFIDVICSPGCDRKILIYISAMLAFKQISRNVKDKKVIQERMKGVSSTVVDGLVARFTESARDSNE